MNEKFLEKFDQFRKGIESPHATERFVEGNIKSFGNAMVQEYPDDEEEIREFLRIEKDRIIGANHAARPLYGYND